MLISGLWYFGQSLAISSSLFAKLSYLAARFSFILVHRHKSDIDLIEHSTKKPKNISLDES